MIAATSAAAAQGECTAQAVSLALMPMCASHMPRRRSPMVSTHLGPPGVGSTTGPADRAAATTRSRHGERSKNYARVDSACGRGGDELPDADAKLRAEPTKLRTEFARRRRYFRRA